MGQIWPKGSIILLCVYVLGCFKSVALIAAQPMLVSSLSDFSVQLSYLTKFFIQYGPQGTMVVLFATLALIVQSLITKKIVTTKASLWAFVVLFLWNSLYIISFFLPIFKLASLGGKG